MTIEISHSLKRWRSPRLHFLIFGDQKTPFLNIIPLDSPVETVIAHRILPQGRFDQRISEHAQLRAIAKQSSLVTTKNLDRFVAYAPRDDGQIEPLVPIRREAWIHSAASFTSGAAARTSASTLASNLAKFFWNMPTKARAVLSNSALSFQVLTGSRMSLGTPGRAVGTAKPKYLSVRNSTLRKEPSSAAVSSARVTLIGIREPMPYLPPVHPVLTSQQSTLCLAISARSMLP